MSIRHNTVISIHTPQLNCSMPALHLQYALAIVIYQWLSGYPPFQGTTLPELYGQHLSAQPEPLTQKVQGLSPRVDYVVQKALAKDPHDRYRSINDFANALQQATQNTAIADVRTAKAPLYSLLASTSSVPDAQADIANPLSLPASMHSPSDAQAANTSSSPMPAVMQQHISRSKRKQRTT